MLFKLAFAASIVVTGMAGCSGCEDMAIDRDGADPLHEGSEVTLVASGESLTPDAKVTWDFGDGVSRVGGATERHLFQQDGHFTVQVSHDGGHHGTLDVDVDNVAPDFTIADAEWIPGRAYELLVPVVDPGRNDVFTVAIDWGDGAQEQVDPLTSSLLARHAYGAEGTFPIHVTVSDDGGGSADRTMSLHVFAHQLLAIQPALPAWVAAGSTLAGRVDATATDPAHLAITLASAPAGMTLDGNGAVRWTPAADQAGVQNVVFEVSDGTTTAQRTVAITVSAVVPWATATIGAAGGTIAVTDAASALAGVKLDIPAGALDHDEQITIAEVSTPPPGSDATLGPVIELLPSGLTFAVPASLAMPLAKPADGDVELQTYEPYGLHGEASWDALETTAGASSVSSPIYHFSTYRGTVIDTKEVSFYTTDHVTIAFFRDGINAPPTRYTDAGRADYVPDVPHEIQDLADGLENARTKFAAEGFSTRDMYYVWVADLNGYQGATKPENLKFNIVIRPFDLPTAIDVGAIAAHELFHTCQYRAMSLDPAKQDSTAEAHVAIGASWLWEATATAKAFEIYGGPYGGGYANPLYLFSTDAAGNGRGYEGFVPFRYITSHYGIDLIGPMWSVAGTPEMRGIGEPGLHYLYRRFGELLGGKHPFEAWTDFAFAYQYRYDETFMPGVNGWLKPWLNGVARTVNKPTGAERESPAAGDVAPEALVPFLGLDMFPFAVTVGGRQVAYAIAPACSVGDDCATKLIHLPDKNSSLIIRAGISGDGAANVRLSVYIVDPEDRAAPPLRVGAGRAIGGEPYLFGNEDIEIPLAYFYDHPNHRLVLAYAHDPGDDAFAASVRPLLFFRPSAGVVEVSSRMLNTCVRLGSGKVRCWGPNTVGQLGNETTSNTVSVAPGTFVSIGGTPLTNTSFLLHGFADGYPSMCTGNGSDAFWCFGNNSYGAFGDGTAALANPTPRTVNWGASIVAATGGPEHICAITSTHTLYCSGSNGFGVLGQPLATASSTTPLAVSGLGSDIAEVSASYLHTCARTTGGAIYCWGSNFYGALGRGFTSNPPNYNLATPALANVSGAVSIAAGGVRIFNTALAITSGGETCAALSNGQAWCWGQGDASGFTGATANGVPGRVQDPADASGYLADVEQVTVGGSHACARKSQAAGGTVYCWGYNYDGEIGTGAAPTFARTAVQVPGVTTAISISTGLHHTCAVLANGALTCWGTPYPNTPTAIPIPE